MHVFTYRKYFRSMENDLTPTQITRVFFFSFFFTHGIQNAKCRHLRAARSKLIALQIVLKLHCFSPRANAIIDRCPPHTAIMRNNKPP